MKILQFGKFYYPTSGGMERALLEITEGLNDHGIKCDVLCSNTSRDNEVTKFDKYSVYRTASYGIINSTSITPSLIYRLWKMHKEYDIIDVHHPDPMAFLALFLVRPKAKIVIHWQSDIVRQRVTAKLFSPLQNWVLRRSEKIILASEAYGKHSKSLQKYLDKMAVVPIGIDDRDLQIDIDKRDEIKSRYRDKKIIFALGRLVTYKGFDYLIESAKYLSDEYIILIGGKGPEEDNLISLINKFGLEDRVEMLGYISEEEKYAYFEMATIFSLPSISKAEAFGVVLIEAMAYGKPIVLSSIEGSGMNWVNQDGVTGFQVEPMNAKAIAEAIKKITLNEELYRVFSQNSLNRFKTIFTRDNMINLLEDLYRSILEK